MKRILPILLVVLLAITCTEEETTPRSYPRIVTKPVAAVTVSGATFSGEITYTSVPLLDHGFLWTKESAATLGSAEKISLGSRSTAGMMTATVDRSLSAGVKYFVRAYARSAHHIVYGNLVEFVSLGSNAPEIHEVSPANGTWGDTVTIIGKNFGDVSSSLRVTFDSLRSDLIFASPDTLKAVVPAALAIQTSGISVAFGKETGTKADVFHLHGPEITSVAPAAAPANATIEITGKYFSPSHTEVYFNQQKVVPSSISASTIKVKVPNGLPDGTTSLRVKTGDGLEDVAGFIFMAAKITGLFPTQGTFGDILTIAGELFDDGPGVTVTIGGEEAEIVSFSPEEIKVVIPNHFVTSELPVIVEIGNYAINAPTPFLLFPPEITSIEPGIVDVNGVVVIYGKYFSPIDNGVTIGGQPAQVLTNYTEALEVQLSYDNLSTHVMDVVVTTAGQQSSESITLKSAWKKHANYPVLRSYLYSWVVDERIFVLGHNHPTPSAVMYEYDVDADQWLSRSTPAVGSFGRAASFAAGSALYLVPEESPDVWKYTPATDQWTIAGPSPTAAREMIGFSVNGKGYLTGGYDPVTFLGNQALWELNPADDSWTPKNETPFEFYEKNAAEWNGEVYLFGGDIYRYSPGSDSWTTAPFLPGFILAIDGKAYIALEPYFDTMTPYDLTSNNFDVDAYVAPQPWQSVGTWFTLNGKGFVIMNYSLPQFMEFDPAIK